MECSSRDGDRLAAASRLAVSIWVVGDVRREVKSPRPAASWLSFRLSAAGPDQLSLCRSSPVGDVRRDLKGAWQHPRPSRVRRRSTEITRLRCHAETQDYIARKRTEGKNTKEAIRCLKRHLTRRVWHLLLRGRRL